MNSTIADEGIDATGHDPYLALPLEGIRLIEASAAADPGAPGGGGRREAGLPARRPEPEGRSLPATAVRRPV
ncbi:hypothetical protein G6F61_014948 [Rhizopus arrhizus]|nr:hypothetical protein G6F61_014948 [Rhizopus arrhizus]